MWKKNGFFEPKRALKRRQKLVLICSIRNINFVTFSAQFAYPLSFPSILYSKIFPWAKLLPTHDTGPLSWHNSIRGLCPDPWLSWHNISIRGPEQRAAGDESLHVLNAELPRDGAIIQMPGSSLRKWFQTRGGGAPNSRADENMIQQKNGPIFF